MIKEIFEQPKVISDCLAGRVDQAKNEIILPEVEGMEPPERLHIIACGTSYHAGLWGKYLIEQWAKIPVKWRLLPSSVTAILCFPRLVWLWQSASPVKPRTLLRNQAG